jgi:hypothetical protein
MTDHTLLDTKLRTFRLPAVPAVLAMLPRLDLLWAYDVASGWVHVRATRSTMLGLGMLLGLAGCAALEVHASRPPRAGRVALGEA